MTDRPNFPGLPPPAWPPDSTDVPVARPVIWGTPAPVAHPILLRDQSRAAAWVDIALVVVGVVAWELMTAMLVGIASGPTPEGAEASTRRIESTWFIPLIAARTLGVTAVVGAIVAFRRQPLSAVGLDLRRPFLDLSLGIAAWLTALAFTMAYGLLIWSLSPELSSQMQENTKNLLEFLPQVTTPVFLALALLIGYYEELLFRGFLLPRLRRGLGSWTLAIIASAAIFAPLHLDLQTPAALVPIFVLAVVFSLVTIWRRSVVPAIVGHTLFNFFMFMGLRYAESQAVP